jgi:Zn-finger nucleic acid-binding protein
MLYGKLRDVPLHECGKCYGLWLDTASFEYVCRRAEQQAAILGSAQPTGGPTALAPVRYLRCPQCNEMMHRLNFARCSGVIVDVCSAHGTWFDANELHRIVHFIRAGGLDRSRAKEKAELSEERRRVQAARLGTERVVSYNASTAPDAELFSLVVQASGDLLTSWLRH